MKRQRNLRAPIENAALAFQERVVWPLGDGARDLFEALGWPFERIAWALRRALVWPLRDRAATLSGRGRVAATAGSAVAVGAIAVAVAVVAFAGSGGSSGEPAAARVAVAATPAPVGEFAIPPAPKPAPTLHGAAPAFKAPASKQGSTEVDPAQEIASAPADSGATAGASAATDKISSRPSSPTGAATSSAAAEASTIPGPEAGAAAIAVARKFSAAFVVYETGGEQATVREGFAKTTTPELAKALLKRPPRLPAKVEVPKAKVVNVVAGPSREGVYTLSVSLLRVGVTSELRLEMEKLKDKGWRVTNVLG
ncbi:MAG: hypothetical protein ACOYD4_07365 [Solirubrobacterales bacterium]